MQEVIQGGLARRGIQQRIAVKVDCLLQQVAQPVVFLELFLFFGGEFLQLDPGALRQAVQRFAEIDILLLHQELEDIAALVALTEAAPCARLRPDDKGRRARVAVERTEAGVVLARAAQLDTSSPSARSRMSIRDLISSMLDMGQIIS